MEKEPMTRSILIASALLLTAVSTSFAQGSASFAEGIGAEQYSESYPDSGYGNAPQRYRYYNYAPNLRVGRHSTQSTGAQR
jgi:hypothetical protein